MKHDDPANTVQQINLQLGRIKLAKIRHVKKCAQCTEAFAADRASTPGDGYDVRDHLCDAYHELWSEEVDWQDERHELLRAVK